MSLRLELISHEPHTSAEPIPPLFIHGAWHGAWCWDVYFLPYFAQHGYHAHALSLRGHGNSDGKWRWASVSDYVDDVAQVAQQFDPPPIIVGHSMGGLVVQKYLEKHPASGAILMASIPVSGALRFLLSYSIRHPLALLRNLLTLSGHFWYQADDVRDAFFSETLPSDELQQYFAQLQGESLRVAIESMGFVLPKPTQVPQDMPMLVLAAQQDTVFTIKEQERTARAYHTEAIVFDMAHDMMLEPNWQKVADTILAWLQQLQHTNVSSDNFQT